MAHRKKHTANRRIRLRVESLETRRLLAALNWMPAMNTNDAFQFNAETLQTSSLPALTVDVTANNLVYTYPSLDISANQGVFWSTVNNVSYFNAEGEGQTDSDLNTIKVNGYSAQTDYDLSSVLDDGFSYDATGRWMLAVDGKDPDYTSETFLSGRVTAELERFEFSLNNLGDSDLQSVVDPLVQIEPNHKIHNHPLSAAGPARFPDSPFGPTQSALGSTLATTSHAESSFASSDSVLEASFIDIADNGRLTSFNVAAPVIDTVSTARKNEDLPASENQTDSAEVVFRVEPVMARHHRIELPRETTTPRVTELPRDLPRETATPLVSTQIQQSNPDSASLPARISNDFRTVLAGNAKQGQQPTGETAENEVSTIAAVHQAVLDESSTTAVRLISHDEATRSEDTARGKWQTTIDVLMAATVGAVIYSQRERNTADRPSEFRLR